MRWLTVSVLGFAVCACGKNNAVRYAEELADAVCRCADLACVEAARKRSLDELPRLGDATGYESDQRAIAAAGARLKECQDRLAK